MHNMYQRFWWRLTGQTTRKKLVISGPEMCGHLELTDWWTVGDETFYTLDEALDYCRNKLTKEAQ